MPPKPLDVPSNYFFFSYGVCWGFGGRKILEREKCLITLRFSHYDLDRQEPTQPQFFAYATKEKKEKKLLFGVYLRFRRTSAATATTTMTMTAAAAITYMSVLGPASGCGAGEGEAVATGVGDGVAVGIEGVGVAIGEADGANSTPIPVDADEP